MFFAKMGLYDAAGKDDRKEAWPAYMTVEASFLVSFTVILFAVVIYLAFYQYDRCVLAQDLYLLCFRESLLREEENRTAGQEELAQRQFGTKYFLTDRISTKTEEGDNLGVDAGRKLETVRVILCEEDRSAVPYPPFPQSARIAQEGIGRRREA